MFVKKLVIGLAVAVLSFNTFYNSSYVYKKERNEVVASATFDGTVEEFLASAFSLKNANVKNSFNMNGRTYYNGIIMSGYNNSCTASLNVENVDMLSFTVGHIDNDRDGKGLLEIYIDDKFYDSIDLKKSMSLTDITIDVSKSSIIRFNVKIPTDMYGTYGLADFKIDGISSKQFTIPEYNNIDSLISRAFTCTNVKVRTSDDKRNSFNMNGRTYYNGIIMSGYNNSCTASLNVENVDMLSFTVGHIDNDRDGNGILEIYIDDKFYDSIDLKKSMSLTDITIDVSKSSIIRFNVKIPTDMYGTYGIGITGIVSKVIGDCNQDSRFDVADLVLLQKCLLGSDNNDSINLYNADLYSDGRIDVFDLILMREKLLG